MRAEQPTQKHSAGGVSGEMGDHCPRKSGTFQKLPRAGAALGWTLREGTAEGWQVQRGGDGEDVLRPWGV